MRDDEDHHRRACNALLDVGLRDDRLWQLDARKVDYILVKSVDHHSQWLVVLIHPCLPLGRLRSSRRSNPLAILQLDVLLEHPHLHFLVKNVVRQHVQADLGGDGGTPVAGTDESNFFSS